MFDGLQPRHWKYDIDGDRVLTLLLDRAGESVNSLSREVLEELASLIERIQIDPPKAVILRSAKSAGFIAGADIREFRAFAERGETIDAIKRGHRVFAKLADRTTVVVIKNDRLQGVPGYESWWDVAVPEVSESASVQAAREEYEEMRTKERYFLE